MNFWGWIIAFAIAWFINGYANKNQWAFWKKLTAVAIVVFICMNIFGDNEDTSSTNNQVVDYSWIYGTWQLSINGETQIISFSENGHYTDTYRTNFGSGSTMGYFTIESENNRIRLNESGDDYPSYIEIDGKRLKSNGEYYQKK